VLVGAQVALALTLLVGGGLLVRSLRTLLAVPPGFDAAHVLTAELSLPRDRYPDSTRVAGFYARLLPKLAAIPGVRGAALANATPLGTRNPTSGVFVDGGVEAAGSAGYRVVSPGYFAALGIPLRAGRGLLESDRPGGPHAVVVNEAAARRFWPGASPLGGRVRFPGMDDHPSVWLTVVGVVGDVRHVGLDALPAPEMYLSYRQRPRRAAYATLVVRAAAGADPGPNATAVRGVVRAEDPDVPLELSSLRAAVNRSVAPRRLTTAVLTAFALLGLLLAAVGIYGVLSYTVAQRRRELSVRMVLGGRASDIRRMVVRDALAAVAPGVVVGLAAAVLLGRFVGALVYGVRAADPLTFAAVLALLLAVTAAASYLPARRATRVDPLLAVRGD
jgi:predicted permease